MKITKLPTFLLVMIIAGSMFLSACGGGAGVTSSWPGLLVDPKTETVYLAYSTHVYAVNLTNGVERWRFPEKPDNKKQFFAPPALTGDSQLIEGGYDHVLYSINPENGQQNWTFADADDKYIGEVLADGGNIYAPNTNTNLYNIGANGSMRWKFTANHALWAQPITDGNYIYLASMDHRVYAIDPERGTQVWVTQDLGGAVTLSFSYDPAGVLYVGTLDGKMSALNIKDGQILWQTPAKGWIWSKPVLDDGNLYFGDQDGNIFALDAKTGQVRWQVQPDATSPDRAMISTPVVIGETLYFASQAGLLYALDKTKGNDIWGGPKTIGGKIYSDLKSVNELILIAPIEFDSALVAVDLQGKTLWSYMPVK
jgi:outer membrane protein assembly factor BamB